MRSFSLFLSRSASAFVATLAITQPSFAAGDDWGNDKKHDDDEKEDPTAPSTNVPKKPQPTAVEPPAEEWNIYDVHERDGQKYYFAGLRYRADVIPTFLFHPFVDLGKTVNTNAISAEFEIRKDGFSLIPALTYQELGTGDILFRQKNEPDIAGNYSLVNSSMKVIYAQIDLLWSVPLHKNLEFEYGMGFGLGAVFGDLETNWVQVAQNGELASDNGKRYSPCKAVGDRGTGCNAADHQNSQTNKVNGYTESSWVNGGSKPNFLPWISIPQFSLRFKPMKNLVARLGVGFNITGFWFGLGAQYGLEHRPKP